MAAKQPRVLVIEDDGPMRSSIAEGLRREGFEVSTAATGEEGRRAWAQGDVALVVLDLGLPGLDGWALLDARPELPAVPVVVVTARVDVGTRVRAFQVGAVDYLAKPFFMAELVARVQARLQAPVEAPRRWVEFAGARLDLEGRQVLVDGAPVALTPAEFALLAYLARRPGRPISRGTLAEHALSGDGERFDRTIDSHISRLRQKLGPAAACLRTVWGIGWRLDLE